MSRAAARRRQILGRQALAGALAVLMPCVALFCWNALIEVERGTTPRTDGFSPLHPTTTRLEDGSKYAEHLKPVASPFYRDFLRNQVENPFHGGMSREMLAAQGDPFLYAYLNGAAKGSLVSRRSDDGIPVLSVAFSSRGASVGTRKELLRAMELGLAGSLKRFISSLDPQQMENLDAEEDSSVEENPFSRAIEKMTGAAVTEKSPTPVEAKAEKQESKEQTPPLTTNGTPPRPAISGGGSSVNTLRPYLMLQVEPEGSLRVTPVSQPREGTLESAEFGLRDFTIFPLTDPAEFPFSMAVADFNGDTYADLALHVSKQGLLRFFFGSPDGTFEEGLRVEVGRSPSSLAAGDFNRDGWTDLAISNLGTGSLVLLFTESDGPCRRYQVHWLDIYRDYIAAANNPELRAFEVLGMSFASQATVLVDFTHSEGRISGRKTPFLPALNSDIPLGNSRLAKLNAVLMGASLSVNFENRENQLLNVLNLAGGTDIQILVGDLDGNGSVDIGLATPIR